MIEDSEIARSRHCWGGSCSSGADDAPPHLDLLPLKVRKAEPELLHTPLLSPP